MNTFWVHKNWKWKKENATKKYIDENCEEAVTLVDAQAEIDRLTLALEQARRENEELQADARHEGLQYREFATDIAPANTALPDSGMISFGKLKEVIESALDAEWEELAKLDSMYRQQLGDRDTRIEALASSAKIWMERFAQVQGLVRALKGDANYTYHVADNPDEDDQYTVYVYVNGQGYGAIAEFYSRDEALAYAEIKRVATLPATPTDEAT